MSRLAVEAGGVIDNVSKENWQVYNGNLDVGRFECMVCGLYWRLRGV